MKFISYKKCLLLSLLVSLNYVGCTKNGQSGETVIKFTYPKGETLAEVGGTSLSLEGFREDFLARQGTFKGAPHLNTDEKKRRKNNIRRKRNLKAANYIALVSLLKEVSC